MKDVVVIAVSALVLFAHLSQSCGAVDADIKCRKGSTIADFHFETNLPDATLLQVYVSDPSGLLRCQGRTAAHGGIIKDPDSAGCLKALQAGPYLVEIETEFSQFQPEQVRAVIGDKGEHLGGPLAIKKMMGTIVRLAERVQVRENGELQVQSK